MCNYQGYEFGAGYLDSICIDGRLYDADDCDRVDGELVFFEKDYQACPQCRQLEAMDNYADSNLDDCDCHWPRYYAWHLVMDIRRNRGLRSIPLVVWIVYRLWTELTRFDREWKWRLLRWVWTP